MYGTVARMRAKPGMEQQLKDEMRLYESVKIPGAVGSFVYKMDSDPNEYWVIVLFDSKESYWANAQSPEQDARYRKLLDYLAEEPEWHDGEIVYSQILSQAGIPQSGY